jgi:hypothetical protein
MNDMTNDSQIMKAISEQYGAALTMLEETVEDCDEELWQDTNRDPIIAQVVYHTIFEVDLYLSRNKTERENFKGKYGPEGNTFNEPNKPFTKDQLQIYIQEVRDKAEKIFTNLTIEQLMNEPVFEWHGVNLLSSLLYNLRHLMLHVGALHVRVNKEGKMPLRWVSTYPEAKGTKMNNLGVWHLQNGYLAEAEKIYLELIKDSENPLFYYNLACCYSLQDKKDQSIMTLKKCLSYDNVDRFKNLATTDKDFTNVKDLDGFKQLFL